MALQPSLERLLERFAGVVNTAEVARLIERKGRRRLEALLRRAWVSLTPGLRAEIQTELIAITESGFASGLRLAEVPVYTPPLAAIRRARTQAARRVTAMSAQGRRVIRQLVTASIAGGADSRRLAVELVRQGLPLNRVQAGALRKFHDRLQRRVAEGSLTTERAARQLTREAKRMARVRSRVISRTETADARAYARQQSWDESVRRGDIDEREWIKIWHTTDDERTEDICMRLDGQTTTPTGSFDDGYSRPPRHPQCRCSCSIRRRRRRGAQR